MNLVSWILTRCIHKMVMGYKANVCSDGLVLWRKLHVIVYTACSTDVLLILSSSSSVTGIKPNGLFCLMQYWTVTDPVLLWTTKILLPAWNTVFNIQNLVTQEVEVAHLCYEQTIKYYFGSNSQNTATPTSKCHNLCFHSIHF